MKVERISLLDRGIEPVTSQSKVERSTNRAIESFDMRLRNLVGYVLQCCSWIKMGIFKVIVGKRRRTFFGSNFWEQFLEQVLGAIFGTNLLGPILIGQIFAPENCS